MLGPVAQRALARSETVPARRATAGGHPLEALVRLWLLQLPVPEARLAQVLDLDAAQRLGLLQRRDAMVSAVLDVRPYDEGFFVVSDLGTGLDGATVPLPGDHVLGVGGASVSLAELTVRRQVGRSLDLGTGCGVQALHLAGHSAEVVATDVLPRAVLLARLSAGLSDVALDVREGSWFDPVQGERFDLVVSNPPFVVGGEGGHRTYRDGGEPGDALCERLVRQAPQHLTEGGWCQLLANWVHRRDEDWRERVGGWLPEGCDAWALQREVLDPAEYVSLWLHDSGDSAGPRYVELYDTWLAALERDRVEGVGFGWVSLRRTGAADPVRRVEDWPHAVQAPLGPHVLDAFERWDWLHGHPDDASLLTARLRVADDVVQEQVGRPGAEDPEHVVLRQQRGLRRAERVDAATAGLVGACDGSLPLGVLADAVAQVLGEDAAPLRARLLPAVRRLVGDGTLLPA